jgi:hypothetical protein
VIGESKLRATFTLPIVATVPLAFATFSLVSVASAPAHAQTYDPNYPVCMQIYGPVGYLDCRYASLEQCRYLAVGRSATCVVNPYFAQKKPTSPRRSTRAN